MKNKKICIISDWDNTIFPFSYYVYDFYQKYKKQYDIKLNGSPFRKWDFVKGSDTNKFIQDFIKYSINIFFPKTNIINKINDLIKKYNSDFYIITARGEGLSQKELNKQYKYIEEYCNINFIKQPDVYIGDKDSKINKILNVIKTYKYSILFEDNIDILEKIIENFKDSDENKMIIYAILFDYNKDFIFKLISDVEDNLNIKIYPIGIFYLCSI